MVPSPLNALLQGVFGFRGKRSAPDKDERSTPKRAKKGKKAKRVQAKVGPEEATDDQDLGMFSGDDDPALRERYATFKTLWSKVFDVYTTVLHQNFAEIIGKVGDFVSKSGTFEGDLDSMSSG